MNIKQSLFFGLVALLGFAFILSRSFHDCCDAAKPKSPPPAMVKSLPELMPHPCEVYPDREVCLDEGEK
jgi:hypothetical protein